MSVLVSSVLVRLAMALLVLDIGIVPSVLLRGKVAESLVDRLSLSFDVVDNCGECFVSCPFDNPDRPVELFWLDVPVSDDTWRFKRLLLFPPLFFLRLFGRGCGL